MRIEWEVKLGFKDVLIKPKRSTLKTRREVSLQRQFRFRHSPHTWSGIPIIASNMDTIGTFDMAKNLAKEQLVTAVCKHYELSDWTKFLADDVAQQMMPYLWVSTGVKDADAQRLDEVLREI